MTSYLKSIFQVALLLGLTAVLLPADILYNVSVNTSPYLGQSGYLDFQLGSGPDSQRATVTVQSFSTDGTLSGTNRQVSGDVTGMLPGTLILSNSQQFNDYFAGFTYERLVSFTLSFAGPAINAPTGTSAYGSPFYFGLYDSAQRPLGASDPFGNALLIQINTNGSTTSQTYNSAVSAAMPATVPEPGELGLFSVGFALTALISCLVTRVRARGQSRHHHPLT